MDGELLRSGEKRSMSFSKYRVQANHGPYPPYHTGPYLEDYFHNFYHNLKNKPNREYIDITWTACYNNEHTSGLQDELDTLDRNKQYFTVSQHDDAVKETLPEDTLCFNAGGNAGGIPIPLICSPLTHFPTKQTKDILCSFVGSATHPIRTRMYEAVANKDDCVVHLKNWSAAVAQDDFQHFINTANRSKFLLCPRGYGLNSFRLYEAFQLGCVPVIITDKFFLPWEDELDWSEFSVLIHEDMIPEIHDVLSTIDDEYYHHMLNNGSKLYKDYFTLNGVCEQICRRIK